LSKLRGKGPEGVFQSTNLAQINLVRHNFHHGGADPTFWFFSLAVSCLLPACSEADRYRANRRRLHGRQNLLWVFACRAPLWFRESYFRRNPDVVCSECGLSNKISAMEPNAAGQNVAQAMEDGFYRRLLAYRGGHIEQRSISARGGRHAYIIFRHVHQTSTTRTDLPY
jgi:hypothetical protein